MENKIIDPRLEGWDAFTFRCSSLGHIMSAAKGDSNLEKYNKAYSSFVEKSEKYALSNKETKASEKLFDSIEKLSEVMSKLEPVKNLPHLSDGCKTHLADVYTRVLYGRKEDIKSKYILKGLEMEEDAITLYSTLPTVRKFYEKNKKREYNEFIEGEIDFIDLEESMVLDTKVNWSIFQFNRVKSKPLNKDYFWQQTGYCWLFNTKSSRLVYSLLNTPKYLVEKEIKNLKFEMFGSEINYSMATEQDQIMFEEASKEIVKNHTYDDISQEERVFTIDIKRDDDAIDLIKQRVADCRIYLNNFSKSKIEEDESD